MEHVLSGSSSHFCIEGSHHWEKMNVRVLSTTLHGTFNSDFNWTVDIWSIYSRALLHIFGLYLRLNGCRSLNANLLSLIKSNYDHWVLDLCSIILFQKLWNIQYIYMERKSENFNLSILTWCYLLNNRMTSCIHELLNLQQLLGVAWMCGPLVHVHTATAATTVNDNSIMVTACGTTPNPVPRNSLFLRQGVGEWRQWVVSNELLTNIAGRVSQFKEHDDCSCVDDQQQNKNNDTF